MASPIGLCRLRLDSLIGLVIECGTEIKGTGRCLAPLSRRCHRGMRGDFPAITPVIAEAVVAWQLRQHGKNIHG